jgi:TolB-like protein/DNA-binding SARP family transcriptional activator/Flp pilus assembly protein TadD
MLRLKLFGVPSLERDGALVGGRAAQRHRLALLALLALAPGRRLGRDKLIAWLWPESDSERGRNLLKVSTYVLRSALGDSALLSAGDELRLSTELIEVDVAEFEAALDQEDHAHAAALYEGPFMDGFFVSEAPEFEQWVDRERERLAGGYRKALEALAGAAEDARDFPAAVEWWKARAVQDPYDSRVALRFMQALVAGGNRVGALQHAAIHQRLLQAEFGVEPAPEIAVLAERLRREPATEAPLVDQTAPSSQPTDDPETSTPEAPDHSRPAEPVAAFPLAADRGSPARRTRRLAAVALLGVLSLAGAVLALRPRATDREGSIVVLPFIDLSADQNGEYFSDGLTEEIITRLAAVPGLKVISRTSAMHYKGSTKSLPQIAAELDVDHILEGSVRQGDGRVRISAQLIDARSDGHLWAENYEHEMRDAFRIQEDIAREVARALEVKLGDRAQRLLARQGTRDPEAYQLYRRGRFLWNTRTREGHEGAIEYFRRAIERDSNYADAYAGLADVYLTGFQLNLLGASEAEAYSRLTWAAERALALDDESADAHVAFAIALWWQRNWPGAARELRRAIDLNPGHATARSWYSLLLRGMGRSANALRESRLASELDPFAVVATYNYAWQCYVARDFDCAIEQFRRSLEINQYPSSYRGLGLIYAQKGMADEATRALRQAIDLAPQRSDFLADLAYVQALAGRTEDARMVLGRAKAQPFEGFNIARAHVALGEPDSAFAWLERSNWRWPHRATRGDPALDPLRSDPRFARLVERVEREMGLR